MESINGVNLKSLNLGLEPYTELRNTPLGPEIRKIRREETRIRKLNDFERELNSFLPVDGEKIDQDLTREIDRLMTKISGRDLHVRNQMVKVTNRALKDRGDSVRFAMLPLQENALDRSSLSDAQGAYFVIDRIRDIWSNGGIYKIGSDLALKDLCLEELRQIGANVLCSTAIEMMIQVGVISGSIALRTTEKAIFRMERIRHQVVVHLYQDGCDQPEVDRATHRIIVPRDLMPMLSHLREILDILSAAEDKDLQECARDLASSKQVNKQLKILLRKAGLKPTGDSISALSSLGSELEKIGRLSVQPYLRDLYANDCVSTPLITSDEKSFCSNLRIVRQQTKAAPTSGADSPDFIPSESPHEGMKISKFNRVASGIIQLADENMKRSGATAFRAQLRIELRNYFAKEDTSQLSEIQLCLLRFLWHMAVHGTPDSAKNERVGVRSTILRYFGAVSSALQIEFQGDDFLSLTPGEIVEGIDAILNATKKRSWYGKRIAYFLTALEAQGCIDEVSNCVIQQYGSEAMIQARAQVISKSDFERSLKEAAGLPTRSMQYGVIAMLSIGYRAGLRFVEAYKLQLKNIQIGRSKVVVTVRAKGGWRPKSPAGNRWVLMLGQLSFREYRALLWMKRALSSRGRKCFVFHALFGDSTRQTRSRIHGVVLKLLKSATGSSRACFHDLRHTFINRYVLAYYKDHALTRQLEHIANRVAGDVELAGSLRHDGCKAPYWAVVIAEKGGQGCFNPTTAQNYFHFGAEVYAHCWTMSDIPELTFDSLNMLCGGRISSILELEKLRSSAYQSQVPESVYKHSDRKLDDTNIPELDISNLNISSIGSFLIGESPKGVSDIDIFSPDGRAWAKMVLHEAENMPLWHLSCFRPEGVLTELTQGRIAPSLTLGSRSAFRNYLQQPLGSEYNELLRNIELHDQPSGGRAFFRITDSCVLESLIKALKELKISPERLKVRTNSIETFGATLSYCKSIETVRRPTHQPAECRLSITRGKEGELQGMQEVASLLFVNAISRRLQLEKGVVT